MNIGRQIASLVAAASLTLLAVGQTQKPSFDVTLIKPSAPGNGPSGGGPKGDRLVMTKVTLKSLLGTAYPPPPGTNRRLEVIGGPSWMDTDLFDVEAKADCSNGPIDRSKYVLMVQSLIEDQFQLKAHTEPREVPIYELVIAKGGLKIKPSEDQTPVNPAGTNAPYLCAPLPSTPAPPTPAAQRTATFDPTKMRGGMSMQYAPGSATAIGNAVRISTLMIVLQQEGGRPVVDKTNLPELYDFKLQFSPQVMITPYNRSGAALANGDPAAAPAAADPVPLLTTALEQQLGLRLESAKAPVEVLVVDSAQKPKGN